MKGVVKAVACGPWLCDQVFDRLFRVVVLLVIKGSVLENLSLSVV